MRKILNFIAAGVLMSALCVAFVACNKPNESEPEQKNETTPVMVNDELSEFLNKNINEIIQASLYHYDNSGKLESFLDCIMINSMDELPKIETTYPEIDFTANTLVIGQCATSDTGKYLMSQSVFVEENVATVDLIIGNKKDGDYAQVTSVIPFWGFYPKVDAETVRTNVTIKIN